MCSLMAIYVLFCGLAYEMRNEIRASVTPERKSQRERRAVRRAGAGHRAVQIS